MRKVVAGTLAAIALAWAQGAGAADAEKERKEAADATKAEVRQEGKEAQQSMERGADRAQAEAQARTGDPKADKKHPLFEGKNNFDVKGKVQHASNDKITIQRDDLPEVTLHVSPNTKVEVDGKHSSAQQLKQGQDVRASFNLRGDKPEAVEIKADQLKADDRKEMAEQKRDAQKEMGETQREAQKEMQKSK
jgi:hypothetical protein